LQSKYGANRANRAKLILRRLDDLTDVGNLEESRHIPGKCHELLGDRKGQWAMHLDGPYRLVFTPHNDPIPENDNGQYLWIEILAVEILEVVDYHK
jgi:proteic killer suppression protein